MVYVKWLCYALHFLCFTMLLKYVVDNFFAVQMEKKIHVKWFHNISIFLCVACCHCTSMYCAVAVHLTVSGGDEEEELRLRL